MAANRPRGADPNQIEHAERCLRTDYGRGQVGAGVVALEEHVGCESLEVEVVMGRVIDQIDAGVAVHDDLATVVPVVDVLIELARSTGGDGDFEPAAEVRGGAL